MNATLPGIESLGQVAIPARDLARARAFYKDTLGLKHLFDAPPGLTFFQCGSVRLLVEVPVDEKYRHSASILYYKVPDIEAAHGALAAKAVPVLHAPRLIAPMPDHDLWMSFYRDTEENVFALMCEKRR